MEAAATIDFDTVEREETPEPPRRIS